MAKLKKGKIYLYDTTLRDGGQTSFVDFTLKNKLDLAEKLDYLGVDYIEAGWPGANPIDTGFFKKLPKLKNSKITAFGMTYKASLSPEEDQGFKNLMDSKAKIITIVGKSWDFQVEQALKISLKKNLDLVSESIAALKAKKKEVFFDAEHFFDGYKENPEYSLKVIETAFKAGASWVILCDTNGGTLPHEIKEICNKVLTVVPGDHLGIHCHNDTGNAVANSLAAVEAGARQIQGTLNGLGERCGNANFTSLIPTLKLKLGYEVGVSNEALKNLKRISNYLCDILNYPYDPYAPYVGSAAFSHKGGLHASGVSKNAKSYEHIDPHVVGNSRNILVSNQSGRASIVARLNELNIEAPADKIDKLIKLVKAKEALGFSYDLADASFALLAYNLFFEVPEFFKLDSYKVINEKRMNAKGEWVTSSDAILKLEVFGKNIIHVAEGNGPVSALDQAFRKLLTQYYPILDQSKLSDYKVRILNSDAATDALIRVLIETIDHNGNRWTSVGVATDIIDASYTALTDSINYLLLFGEKTKN